MATFLLSVSAHVVLSHTPPLRTLTALKAESSSPIRLTQIGPLITRYPNRRYLADCGGLASVRSLRVRASPKLNSFQSYLYPVWLVRNCYPERNFARNQLLGGSMSLSPLYADQKNDLHVNKPTGLHQPFDWLRPVHVKITTFRVFA